MEHLLGKEETENDVRFVLLINFLKAKNNKTTESGVKTLPFRAAYTAYYYFK